MRYAAIKIVYRSRREVVAFQSCATSYLRVQSIRCHRPQSTTCFKIVFTSLLHANVK